MTEATTEEKEVIEAAKAWNKAATPENRVCLCKAVDALSDRYESLVSDDELRDLCDRGYDLALRRLSTRLADD